jgi:hypothetical protein
LSEQKPAFLTEEKAEKSQVVPAFSKLRLKTETDEISSMNSQKIDLTQSLNSLVEPEDKVAAKKTVPKATRSGPKEREVAFSTVEVKEYSVILGDNPGANYPLALDWGHTKSIVVNVDSFVTASEHPQRLDAQARLERLANMGFSKKLLREQERDRKIKLLQEWRESQHALDGDEILRPPRAVRID